MHSPLKSDPVQLNRRWRPALMSFFLRRVQEIYDGVDLPAPGVAEPEMPAYGDDHAT